MSIRGDLPPVGHAISLRKNSKDALVEFIGGHQYWVDSGTSALALAIADAKSYFPNVQRPRVIIPGYCCPDLVAACVYASVEPVAIDISKNDPSYDLDCLSEQLDEAVIAIIAVNFLGVSERLQELREIIRFRGVQTRLIEDNAQWFPVREQACSEVADYTVFSFGRGKPLSLLGGGLLVARVPLESKVRGSIGAAIRQSSLLSIKIKLYNLLLTPQFYLLLNRNPFLQLGETKYSKLETVNAMDEFRIARLGANFKLYVLRREDIKSMYEGAMGGNGLQQMSALNSSRARQLLRYPLLCSDAEAKKNLLEKMGARGLGVTAMYKVAIDQIEGVDGLVSVPRKLVNAEDFAARFMTLPLHAGVTSDYREEILAFLDA